MFQPQFLAKVLAPYPGLQTFYNRFKALAKTQDIMRCMRRRGLNSLFSADNLQCRLWFEVGTLGFLQDILEKGGRFPGPFKQYFIA